MRVLNEIKRNKGQGHLKKNVACAHVHYDHAIHSANAWLLAAYLNLQLKIYFNHGSIHYFFALITVLDLFGILQYQGMSLPLFIHF